MNTPYSDNPYDAPVQAELVSHPQMPNDTIDLRTMLLNWVTFFGIAALVSFASVIVAWSLGGFSH